MSFRVQRSQVEPSDGGSPRPAPSARLSARIRVAGVLLTAGVTTWAVGILIAGDTVADGVNLVDAVTGLGYVVGLFCLALVVLAVRATGERKGRVFPIYELVLLPGAGLVNLISIGYAGTRWEDLPPWLAVLDACWPLSQLGMIALGIAVVRVGRVRGFLRWHFLLCGLWLPVAVAGQAIGGLATSLVGALWLLGTYATLGLRMALRPADLLPAER